MSVINILSPHVADMIAAGEVVDRPANVVKELVENAIDAGAKRVTVEIIRGGTGRIRVMDDGCGMAPEDAGIAFLRHATSKLKTERDLEAIGTLGFRGEALAAIASVSRITLFTRRPEDEAGTRMVLDAGEIQQMEPCGCPVGTSITVEDLFFNTPARRKFLKTDKAEGAACVAMALRCALGRPELRLRCLRDGQEQFFSPGDGVQKSAIYALLGRDFAAGLLPCRGECEGVTASGFVSAPHAGRGNRTGQYFFVNGRAIRSPLLQAAVEQAYKNRLLTGRFPACVIWLELGFGGVDVNVHPTKNEVRFSQEKTVFDAVFCAVSGALEQDHAPRQMQLSPKPIPADTAPDPEKIPLPEPVKPSVQRAGASTSPRPDFFQTMTAADFRRWKPAPGQSAARPAAPRSGTTPRAAAPIGQLRQPEPAYIPQPAAPQAIPLAPEKSTAVQNSVQNVQNSSLDTTPPAPEPEETSPLEQAAAPAPRLIGEALGTYIIVEQGDKLLLIDKHAAHERILFDRLAARRGGSMSQPLLAPISFSPGPEAAELLLAHQQQLDDLGFVVEAFGPGTVIVRAAPEELQGSELVFLEELTDTLQKGGPAALGEERLHSMACKAAIKAGHNSDPRELLPLAKAVLAGEIQYCPHGRPIAITLTRRDLDKQFSRIV